MQKVLLIIGLLTLALTGTAAASGGSIAVDQAAPTFGSAVTFTTSLPNPKPNETFWVRNSCSQAGVEVYFETRTPGSPFMVGPTLSWTGGAADCQGVLWSAKNGTLDKVVAVASYHVAG